MQIDNQVDLSDETINTPLEKELEHLNRDQFSLCPFSRNGIRYTKVDLDRALEDQSPTCTMQKVHKKIAGQIDMEGVGFVLYTDDENALHLCALYIACHLVYAHKMTLMMALELVTEKILKGKAK